MSDLRKFIVAEVYGEGGAGLLGKFKRRYLNEGTNAVLLLRCSLLSKSYVRRYYCARMLRRRYGICCGQNTKIGIGLQFPHPQGIIIGDAVVIGENCRIYQQVTLGSAKTGDYKLGLQPHLGNNCLLFSGAKIIGAVTLGDGVTVGANAVLLKDAPDGVSCVGVPARIIDNRRIQQQP